MRKKLRRCAERRGRKGRGKTADSAIESPLQNSEPLISRGQHRKRQRRRIPSPQRCTSNSPPLSRKRTNAQINKEGILIITSPATPHQTIRIAVYKGSTDPPLLLSRSSSRRNMPNHDIRVNNHPINTKDPACAVSSRSDFPPPIRYLSIAGFPGWLGRVLHGPRGPLLLAPLPYGDRGVGVCIYSASTAWLPSCWTMTSLA